MHKHPHIITSSRNGVQGSQQLVTHLVSGHGLPDVCKYQTPHVLKLVLQVKKIVREETRTPATVTNSVAYLIKQQWFWRVGTGLKCFAGVYTCVYTGRDSIARDVQNTGRSIRQIHCNNQREEIHASNITFAPPRKKNFIPCPYKPGHALVASSTGPWTRTYRLWTPPLISCRRLSGRRTQDHTLRCSEYPRLGHRCAGHRSAARLFHAGSDETSAGAPTSAVSWHSGNRIPHCCNHTARVRNLVSVAFQPHRCGGA